MHKQGITWIEAEDFHLGNKDRILESIDAFLAQVDQLYLTIDLDVFAAPYAPGVSAVAFCGIVPDHFLVGVTQDFAIAKTHQHRYCRAESASRYRYAYG